jgi:hypothetical protein
MFRNLAMAAIVSVCAVSTGSPAWSQNSPGEAKPPPSDRQFAPSNFQQLQMSCLDIQSKTNDEYCYGEEARLLFKFLGDNPSRTTQVGEWLKRDNTRGSPKIVCWTRNDSGKDPIVSMIYACSVSH